MGTGGVHSRAGARLRLAAFVAVLAAALVAIPVGATDEGTGSFDLEQSQLTKLARLAVPIHCGGGNGPYVALTFDDGPGRDTPALVRVLRDNGVHATFFDVGRAARHRRRLVRAQLSVGDVGVHTWSHETLTSLPRERVMLELHQTQWLLERFAGESVQPFRPPFGARNDVVDAAGRDLRMVDVLWSVDSGDGSEPSTPSPQKMAANVLSRVQGGSIVLFHENTTGAPQVAAMEILLPELRRRGFVLVTVSELLTLDPPSAAQAAKGMGGCDSRFKG